MSDRITRKDLDNALSLFCKRGGFRLAESYSDIEGLQFSHDLGGWNVEKIVSKGGGVSQPFGAMRRTTRDMFETLHFAADALWEANP
jgi:hypothetical protein